MNPPQSPPLDWPIWIGLDVDDLQGQLAYYRDVLGFDQTSSRSFSFGEGRSLELSQAKPRGPKGYSVAYQFPGPTLESFEAACALLVRRGAQLEGPLQTNPDYAWGNFVDPEGNRYVVKWVKPGI